MDYKNYVLGVFKSPVDKRDYIAESIYPLVKDLQLPETLDYRNVLQPVRDQGSQGSCAAQTAACMKEWQEKTEVKLNQYMSPQFVYNNREDLTIEGMYSRDVMSILNNFGCCRESVFSYGSSQTKSNIPKPAFDDAIRYKIQSYASVTTIDGLKTALYKNGPCYIAFPVYNYGPQLWKQESKDQPFLGGHAMTVVGYNKDGFIIRNSWGSSWNNGGYTIYPYTQFGMHWEIWSAIDDISPIPDPEPEKKTGCLCF